MWAEKRVFSLFPFSIKKNYRWGGEEDKEKREKVGDTEERESTGKAVRIRDADSLILFFLFLASLKYIVFKPLPDSRGNGLCGVWLYRHLSSK